jgi:hypothetical protein
LDTIIDFDFMPRQFDILLIEQTSAEKKHLSYT